MTLRADIEIVPFGQEEDKRQLYRLDISNVGLVRNDGFGHEIYRYRVELKGRILQIPGQPISKEEWEVIDVDWIEEHDRRDGAVALIAKAAKLMEERA